MSEEEDSHSEGKEDFNGKEEKLHTVPFHFIAVMVHLEKENGNVLSDRKMINHAFEINSPPPNC